jgi:hypothetical protein
MKLFRVQSMYTMTHVYPMSKDRHMEKFKKVMVHSMYIMITMYTMYVIQS